MRTHVRRVIELTYMLPYVKERMARSMLADFPEERDVILQEIRTEDLQDLVEFRNPY